MWGDGTVQCQVVLLVWIMVGQGHTVLAVGAGEGSSDFFLSSIIFLFLLDFTSFSIESQLYQDDRWVMDDCAQWKSRLRSKRS